MPAREGERERESSFVAVLKKSEGGCEAALSEHSRILGSSRLGLQLFEQLAHTGLQAATLMFLSKWSKSITALQ